MEQTQERRSSIPPSRRVGSFDELRDAAGAIRAHQAPLAQFLESKDIKELEELGRVVRQRITQQEVTFNILGVPEGTNRPWQLDAVPLVLDRTEWLALSAGLRQRARLLNAVIRDCYGSQQLVRDGLLPAELVLGHPEFLRACHGWQPISGEWLHLYAADVGRDSQGRFRVFSDRTQAPTGAGYALENRLVLGRALPELFREYRVERVAGFFAKVRHSVESLAPPGTRGQPRVVLLSAGARDESSFEHAYLARYLGYELVEGRDLSVRGGHVYLKTLSGLRKVDVVLRRIGDAWSDPLELREDSLAGVAGLTSAARLGNVGLANPLGAVIGETPAFKAYLPALCKHLLGEPLALESVPTLWCGDPESLREVLSHPDEFVIKPAFGDRRGEPYFPAQLSSDARRELFDRLRVHSGDFVAERWPELSWLPVLERGELSSGTVAFRSFLVRDSGDYDVMPGGLARINEAPDGLFLAIKSNAHSKDVWIPAVAGSAEPALPAMPDQRVELQRGGLDLPSRLLDDIYWLGRYVERVDATARLARAGFERIGSEAGPDAPLILTAIVETMRKIGVVPRVAGGSPGVPHPGQDATPAEALLYGLLADRVAHEGLPSMLGRIHGLTLSVRSRLSRDAWHVLRRLTRSLTGLEAGSLTSPGVAIEALDQLIFGLAAVSGTTLDNMVRGHAWTFLDLGRRIERGAYIVALLQAFLAPGATRLHMEALLEVADSLLTYRARYLSSLQAPPVVDLLLTDTTNPRSVAYQVELAKDHLRRLPGQAGVVRGRAERRVIMLESTLLTADVEQACAGDGAGLRQLLEEAHVLFWQLSDDISATWFSLLSKERAVSPPHWVNEDLEAT
ncbi:MAG TPA: circularly permuted type 2 ATP-grasp protein [Polyangiaceae bacterium]